MNLISTRLHAWLDYLSGLFLLASPWIFQLRESETGFWILILAGTSVLISSIFTNYEGGVVKGISMTAHLNLDLFYGVFLIASPWLFGFADDVYIPHLAIGAFSIVASLLTSRKPYTGEPKDSEEQKDEALRRTTPVQSKLTE